MPRSPENRSHLPSENEETQTILRIFERIESRGYRNVFPDWITMMLCALNSPPREEDVFVKEKARQVITKKRVSRLDKTKK